MRWRESEQLFYGMLLIKEYANTPNLLQKTTTSRHENSSTIDVGLYGTSGDLRYQRLSTLEK